MILGADTILLEQIYVKNSVIQRVISLVEHDELLTGDEKNVIYELYKEDRDLFYNLVIEAEASGMSRRGFLGSLLKGAAAVASAGVLGRSTARGEESSLSPLERQFRMEARQNLDRVVTKYSAKMPFESLKKIFISALNSRMKSSEKILKSVQDEITKFGFIPQSIKAEKEASIKKFQEEVEGIKRNVQEVSRITDIESLKKYIQDAEVLNLSSKQLQDEFESAGMDSVLKSFSGTVSNLRSGQ